MDKGRDGQHTLLIQVASWLYGYLAIDGQESLIAPEAVVARLASTRVTCQAINSLIRIHRRIRYLTVSLLLPQQCVAGINVQFKFISLTTYGEGSLKSHNNKLVRKPSRN